MLQDLFPGVVIPEHDYGRLKLEIEEVARQQDLQVVESQTRKVIDLYETMLVRHGVMLVGPTGGGKTTVYRNLAKTCETLHAEGLHEDNPFFMPVHIYAMNPKSITMGELYGEINKLTLEWKDGLMGLTVRNCVNVSWWAKRIPHFLPVQSVKVIPVVFQDTTEDHQWVVCDGPVDALWIENMNTVLDDNKMLCLANSERIKFTPYIHMLFEVQDLAVASPATVSRCGMVYVDPGELGWQPLIKTWMATVGSKFTKETQEYLMELFDKYVDDGLAFIKKKCTQAMAQARCKTHLVILFCLRQQSSREPHTDSSCL